MPSTPAEPATPSLVTVYAISAMALTSNTVLAPSLPEILDDLTLGKGWAGIIVGAGSLPGVVMAPVFGTLADRYGKRLIVTIALTIFGLASIPIMTAESVWVLIGGRLIQGVGASSLVSVAIAIIADHWSGLTRSRYIGGNSAVITTCIAVFPLIAGQIAEIASWRAALALQLASLPVAIATWRNLPPEKPDASVSLRQRMGALGSTATRKDVRPSIAAGFVLFLLVFGVFLTLVPLYLDIGLSVRQRSWVIAMPGLFAVMGSLAVGRLRVLMPNPWTLVAIGVSIFAVAFGGLSVAPVLLLVLACVAIYGFAEGITIPTLQDVTVSTAEPNERATFIALFTSGSRAGQTVGPVLASAIAAAAGERTGFFVAAMIAVGAAVVIRLQVRGLVTPKRN